MSSGIDTLWSVDTTLGVIVIFLLEMTVLVLALVAVMYALYLFLFIYIPIIYDKLRWKWFRFKWWWSISTIRVLDVNDPICSVCHLNFEVNQRVRTLDCQHRYHVGCIDEWLNNNHRTCPLCRREIEVVV